MEDDLICEVCGAHLSEHEAYDQESPPLHRDSGVFAGEVWRGLLCPEPYADDEA